MRGRQSVRVNYSRRIVPSRQLRKTPYLRQSNLCSSHRCKNRKIWIEKLQLVGHLALLPNHEPYVRSLSDPSSVLELKHKVAKVALLCTNAHSTILGHLASFASWSGQKLRPSSPRLRAHPWTFSGRAVEVSRKNAWLSISSSFTGKMQAVSCLLKVS